MRSIVELYVNMFKFQIEVFLFDQERNVIAPDYYNDTAMIYALIPGISEWKSSHNNTLSHWNIPLLFTLDTFKAFFHLKFHSIHDHFTHQWKSMRCKNCLCSNRENIIRFDFRSWQWKKWTNSWCHSSKLNFIMMKLIPFIHIGKEGGIDWVTSHFLGVQQIFEYLSEYYYHFNMIVPKGANHSVFHFFVYIIREDW